MLFFGSLGSFSTKIGARSGFFERIQAVITCLLYEGGDYTVTFGIILSDSYADKKYSLPDVSVPYKNMLRILKEFTQPLDYLLR